MVSNSIVEIGCNCFNRFSVAGHLFRNPNLSSTMQSIIARIIISALIVLPRMPPALLSANPGLIYQVKEKIQILSVSIGSGTSSVLSKSLPFVIEAAFEGCNIPVCCNVASHPNQYLMIFVSGSKRNRSSATSSCTATRSYHAPCRVTLTLQGGRASR